MINTENDDVRNPEAMDTETVHTDTGQDNINDTENSEQEKTYSATEKQLRDELDKERTKVTDLEARLQRLQADFANFRRRSNQEKAELSNIVVQEFIKGLLPVVDNFERALLAEAGDGQAMKEGVQMIFNQLVEQLKKHGLQVIETSGKKFDPNFHQAVIRVEDSSKEDDYIEEELQKGYMVKDKVIRPSMVKVVSN